MLSRLQDGASSAATRSQKAFNNYIPPQRRSDLYNSVSQWANENPKLSAFIAVHAALSLPAILLFLTFAVTVLLTTVLTALTLAFSATVFFLFLASCVLLPVLAFTTCSAIFFFLCGLALYTLIVRFNADPRTESIRRNVTESAQTVSNRVQDQAQGAFQRADRVSGGSVSKSLEGVRETLQGQQQRLVAKDNNGYNSSTTGTGNVTPSQPPSYHAAAAENDSLHPVGSANGVSEATDIGTVNGSVDGNLKSSLTELEKVSDVHVNQGSRPALF